MPQRDKFFYLWVVNSFAQYHCNPSLVQFYLQNKQQAKKTMMKGYFQGMVLSDDHASVLKAQLAETNKDCFSKAQVKFLGEIE